MILQLKCLFVFGTRSRCIFLLFFSPCVMSHPSPNELESIIHAAEEASGAGYEAALGGAAAPAGRPAQDQPRAKRTKCAFAGDVDMPQAASESYERWSSWRDHVSATFRAFLSDDAAAKRAGEYHVELMHRGLDWAGVDVATAWAAPSVEPHEALLMMGLYEAHARWKLDVVAGEWRHVSPPAQAPTQGAAPPAQGPQSTDPVRAEIAALEARLAQLRGPSVPQLSLGELQRIANVQLRYAWQRQLVETLVIFLRSEAPQQGYGQSEVATALADGTWAALWPTLGIQEGEFPARQQTPQAAKAGPPGACFKCGLHGHWARDCNNQQSHSQSPQQSQPQWQPQGPRGRPAGGFSVHGDQTLYTAFSTGRTYDARAPPPYPCVRCNGMHWSFHPCPSRAQQPTQQQQAPQAGPPPPPPFC